jgi:hypothetical protein
MIKIVSLLAAPVAWVVPFIPMIRWYTGPLNSSTLEHRSLVAHAWYWWNEAPFGPWIGPALIVVIPPALVLTTVLLPRAAVKLGQILEITAAICAWAFVFAVLAGVGEDIVFTWLRMPAPLAVQATVVSIWAGTRLWERRRGVDRVNQAGARWRPDPPAG